MTAEQLTFWNRIVATEVFIIALLTFGLTVEPTASFGMQGSILLLRQSFKWVTPLEPLFSK